MSGRYGRQIKPLIEKGAFMLALREEGKADSSLLT